MLLYAKLLEPVYDINNFGIVETLKIPANQTNNIYFQLFSTKGNQIDLRYIPSAGAAITVKFDHIDSNKVITRSALNPFIDDRSIWLVTLFPNELISNNSMQITLHENGEDKMVLVESKLHLIQAGNSNSFC
jgi:hypothetical protein